jgi:hypothetical protein
VQKHRIPEQVSEGAGCDYTGELYVIITNSHRFALIASLNIRSQWLGIDFVLY